MCRFALESLVSTSFAPTPLFLGKFARRRLDFLARGRELVMRSDSDADYEVEVAVERPKRKPRTPNPSVDEVIHSGEIDASRSRIVRSSISMPLMVDDEATEVFRAPPLPPPPRRRLRWVWLAAAVASAIAALLLSRMAGSPATASSASSLTNPPSTVELQPVAAMTGAALDGDARAARMRVEAIASSPMLRAGIETDAATLADMARDKDLVISVDRGEVLEVFQLRDSVRTLLIRIPSTAATLQSPGPGQTSFEVRDHGLAVVAAAAIPQRESGISGEVVISAPVDLDPIRKHAAAIGNHTTLAGLSTPIDLSSGTDTGVSVSVPIQSDTTRIPMSLVMIVAAPPPVAVKDHGDVRLARDVCLGLAGLLVSIYLTSRLRQAIRRAPTAV